MADQNPEPVSQSDGPTVLVNNTLQRAQPVWDVGGGGGGGGDVQSVAGLTGEISAWDLGGALGIRSDFGQQAISLARLTGQIQGMARGLADDFQTTMGVDVGVSTAAVRTAVHTFVGRAATAVANNMTANAVPSPQVASASSAYAARDAYFAFDGDVGTFWCAETITAAGTAWLQRRLAHPLKLTEYRVTASSNVGSVGYPSAWSLQGSIDGAAWVTVDTRSGLAFAPSEQKTYPVTGAATYLYYRLQLSAASQYGAIVELQFTGLSADPAATPADFSLRSVAYTATAAPSKAMLTVRAKGTSALTPGTDLRGYVSRDDGTTWTEATLIAGITTGGFTTFEAVEIDLSAQPSGTSMKWRIDATATKAPEIDAVVLQWSAN